MISYERQLDDNLQWALREGSMHFEGESAVHKTLRRLVERLDELGIDYVVAGGMALFFHGFRRFTEDVDFLVTADGLRLIHKHLDGLGYVRPFEKSKNLRDTVTGVKIDFLIAGQFPGDGKSGPVAFPTPSDVGVEIDGVRVIRLEKLVELKLASGQVSHRSGDLNDVQRLIQTLKLPEDFSARIEPSLRESFLHKWRDAQRSIADENEEFPDPSPPTPDPS